MKLLLWTLSRYRVTSYDIALFVHQKFQYWDAQFPAAVESGRVQLQGKPTCSDHNFLEELLKLCLAHDFFTAQPVQKPGVFLLRMILHDWSDQYCVKILVELRKAAGPMTQLLVVDSTLEYACEDTTLTRDIPGAAIPPPPAPLLANKGAAGVLRYFADVHVSTPTPTGRLRSCLVSFR